jgi:hypothetical protein
MPDQYNDDRYPIETLITLHELHPEMREIFVEGRVDAGLISWFLASLGIDCDVFDVDDRIEVPSQYVVASGHSVGKRGRIFGLATILDGIDPDIRRTFLCLADADFDHLTQTVHDLHCLAITDLASLELYMINEASLARFHDLFLHLNPKVDLVELVDRLTPALVDLFLVRYVLQSSDAPPGIVDKVDKYIKLARGRYGADIAGVIEASCATQRVGRDKLAQMKGEVNRLRGYVDFSEPLKFVHWHDLAKVLIKQLGLRNDLAKPDVIERGMMSCAELSALLGYPLFRLIRNRFSSNAAVETG